MAASAVAANKPAPPIVSGIKHRNWDAPGDTTADFERTFALGSPEKAMTDELTREHFRLQAADPDGLRHAFASWGGFPCEYLLDVAWRSSPDGRIADLKARIGSACT